MSFLFSICSLKGLKNGPKSFQEWSSNRNICLAASAIEEVINNLPRSVWSQVEKVFCDDKIYKPLNEKGMERSSNDKDIFSVFGNEIVYFTSNKEDPLLKGFAKKKKSTYHVVQDLDELLDILKGEYPE